MSNYWVVGASWGGQHLGIMNNTEKNTPLWLRNAYGSKADAMLSTLGPTTYQIKTAVDNFYDSIKNIEIADSILNNLSTEEFDNLRRAQARYLAGILTPGISVERQRQKAVEMGYHHCFAGVPTELLAESSILYTDIVKTLTTGIANEDVLKNIISRRLQFDLITQIEVYATIQNNRLDLYNHIAQLNHNGTPLDFIQDSLEKLINYFGKGAVGFAFGSVKNGTCRHLLAKGRVPFGADNTRDQGYPTFKIRQIAQAWFDEKSYVKNSLHGKTDIPVELKEACINNGIRSFGFFLLHDLQYAPKGYLLVCGNHPSYFMNKSMLFYWQQLADLIGASLDLLETSTARRRNRLSNGVHYRQLLARQQVEMHYQPIVDPATGKTVKMEALARLKEGDRILPPDMFLPAFGANQLRDLFEIGLSHIQNDMSRLSDKPPLCSINLPPEAMLDLEWLKALPDCLLKEGATPQRICLEILESSLHDDKEVLDHIFALQEAGYSILLDDVGAGESSLLRIVNLPVSGIKIDQSFVRSLQHSFENLDLILSLRFLALQRGLECVAEGVENENIIDVFSSMDGGRPLLQGYAFSKPMPSYELAGWLQKDKKRQPLWQTPKTLYGWYSRHVERLFTMRNALCTIGDLISIEQLQDAERCPLHAVISDVGGDAEIEQTHREWHANYARFTSLIQAGTKAQELWQAMEVSKLKLRKLIERKIYAKK